MATTSVVVSWSWWVGVGVASTTVGGVGGSTIVGSGVGDLSSSTWHLVILLELSCSKSFWNRNNSEVYVCRLTRISSNKGRYIYIDSKMGDMSIWILFSPSMPIVIFAWEDSWLALNYRQVLPPSLVVLTHLYRNFGISKLH